MSGTFVRLCRDRPKLLISLAAAFISLILVVCVACFLATSYHAALNDGGRSLQQLSLSLSEATERSFETADVIEKSVIAELKPLSGPLAANAFKTLASAQIHLFLKEKITNIAFIDSLSLMDPGGKVINSARTWPVPDWDVNDRDYYRAIADHPEIDTYIGSPVQSRGYGTMAIFVARRFTGNDGHFAGIVAVLINVAYLEHAYSLFDLPGGGVTLYRTNGTPLVSYPRLKVDAGHCCAKLAIFDDRGGQAASGVVNLDGRVNSGSVPQLLAYNRLKDFGAILATSKSIPALLDAWSRMAKIICGVTILLVLLIALTAWSGLSLVRHQLIAIEAEITAQKAIARHASRFEIAVNNILHGLSMFDAGQRLIICNHRYKQLYGLPDHLTKPGTLEDDIQSYLERTSGIYETALPPDSLCADVADGLETETSVLRHLDSGRTVFVRRREIDGGGNIRIHEDVTERRKNEARLTYLARHDPLTGLFNRHVFQERMDDALKMAGAGELFAVICIDLDHFKDINDALGHSTGDLLLQAVAGRLGGCIRDCDTLARIGGDEFAIIQTKITTRSNAAQLARRLVDRLSEPYEIDGHHINVGASAGIAYAPEDDDDATRLLSKADIALYQAKSDGRKNFRFYKAGMNEALQSRRNIETDMRHALERDEFYLCYQPLIDIGTQRTTSFEALLRWSHPALGNIPPCDFIPVAEETGMIIPLGASALKWACAEAVKWPDDINVSVNVSVAQFRRGNLVDTVSYALAETGLDASRLELEITESVLLHSEAGHLSTLHALRALGAKIVMDDFGTGYSSLNYLRIFPFDKIKIDKSFIQNFDQPAANAIVRAIAQLGRMLGTRMTAEGIETAEQFLAVTNHGFDEGQGNLISRPVAASAIAEQLEKPRCLNAA